MLTGAQNRWGDHSATAVDPVDGTFWTIQEYAESENHPGCPTADTGVWGTWWGQFDCGCVLPSEALNLTLAHPLCGPTTLTWSVPTIPGPPPVVYDTIGTTVAADFLTVGPPTFCTESDDGADTMAVEAVDPPGGAIF